MFGLMPKKFKLEPQPDMMEIDLNENHADV